MDLVFSEVEKNVIQIGNVYSKVVPREHYNKNCKDPFRAFNALQFFLNRKMKKM
jgi:hypothetical protein